MNVIEKFMEGYLIYRDNYWRNWMDFFVKVDN